MNLLEKQKVKKIGFLGLVIFELSIIIATYLGSVISPVLLVVMAEVGVCIAFDALVWYCIM